MCWRPCWTTWKFKSDRTVFAPQSPSPLLPRHVPRSPCYQLSWTNTECPSWTYKTVCWSPSPSCSSISARWVKTTSTLSPRYWRTHSWIVTWCTDRLLVLPSNTWPLVCLGSAVRTLLRIWSTTCGLTSLRRRPMSLMRSLKLWKDSVWDLDLWNYCNMLCRYDCFMMCIFIFVLFFFFGGGSILIFC